MDGWGTISSLLMMTAAGGAFGAKRSMAVQRQQHLPPTAAILLQLLAACRIVTHGTAGGHDGGARRAAASATTADDKPLPAGWLLAPEANNLPRVGAAGDTHILGAFTSWGACVNALNAANATQGPFHSITWFAPADTNRHQPPKSSLEGGCFGVRGTEWRPRIHQGVRSARGPGAAPGPCTDDLDCELNGKCTAGVCDCYPGWIGDSCGVLDILPVKDPLVSPVAFGRPPPSLRSGVSDGQPGGTRSGLASWGGSILKDPNKTALFHLFVSEMSLGCGLNAWARNSMIRHATAASPLGPFVPQEVVLPAFSHEPVVVQLPASAGGGYVLYKIGCADNATTGSEDTSLAGPCTGCSNGTTAGLCPPPNQASYLRRCQDVLFSRSLNGPWTRHNLNGFAPSAWDWLHLDSGLESHAPAFRPNGSLLTFTRSFHDRGEPTSSVWLVGANAWNGTYYALKHSPTFNVSTEDSHMWIDPRGDYHALFHTWPSQETISRGGHAFSVDGLNWNYSNAAYNTSVQLQAGGLFAYARRERPHLLLDDDGNPAVLSNGVQPNHHGDWSFTGVFPIRRRHVAAFPQKSDDGDSACTSLRGTVCGDSACERFIPGGMSGVSCAEYCCSYQGLACAGAFEEVDNSCTREEVWSCEQEVKSTGQTTDDLICECVAVTASDRERSCASTNATAILPGRRNSNLPLVLLDAPHGIVDRPKRSATLRVIDNAGGQRNSLTDDPVQYEYKDAADARVIWAGAIAVEIRGSTSQNFPKHSYGFETQTSNADIGGEDGRKGDHNNANVPLLGLPKENDWVLYAPYADKTLLRNVLAFDLAREGTNRYAPRSRFVELYLNGDYQGLYVLMEKIKRDKRRVDVAKPPQLSEHVDESAQAAATGYIVKIDKSTGAQSYHWRGLVVEGNKPAALWIEYPKPEDLTQQMQQYIVAFVSEFEQELSSLSSQGRRPSGCTFCYTSWQDYIDIGSFVDYMIIQELGKNVDGYRLSTFLHKTEDGDRAGGKLAMGPLWDFNLAFDNADYGQDTHVVPGWLYVCHVDCRRGRSCPDLAYPFWWSALMREDQFTDRLRCRWDQLRDPNVGYLSDEAIAARIAALEATLEEAARRNFERWRILGRYVWPNPVVERTWADEIDRLREWTLRRAAWLDSNIPVASRDNCPDLLAEFPQPPLLPPLADQSLQARCDEDIALNRVGEDCSISALAELTDQLCPPVTPGSNALIPSSCPGGGCAETFTTWWSACSRSRDISALNAENRRMVEELVEFDQLCARTCL